MEKGSNDNGTYIKYADGTLICYNNIDMTKFTYQSYKGYTYQWDYPCSFLTNTNPSVVVTSRDWSTYGVYVKSRGIATLAMIMYFVVNPYTNAFVSDYTGGQIAAVAIGRWK